MPDLAARSGLAVDARGQVLVDTYLRRITDDRIFAIGDCAAVPGARFSCQGATPQGSHAATNVARLLTGRAPKPYSMGYLALCVGLGRRDAVLQVNHRDDSPRRVYVAGRSGAVSKAALTRSAKYVARTGPTGFWMQDHDHGWEYRTTRSSSSRRPRLWRDHVKDLRPLRPRPLKP